MESLAQGPPQPGREDESAGSEGVKWLGATMAEASDSLRGRFAIPDPEQGVVVVEVENRSKAEEMGLRPGDLIRSLNQEPVKTLKDFERLSKKARTSKGVVLDIHRRGTNLYLSYMGPEE
ncbi:MAG: hypothetical protein A2636_04330 [Elusimicrobia bacterium RIFCSPHIGHO2_01_FULL_64_10]|nr:MAG: hypothetical protein A2636_04330 [Elusimicrobia bacterium RIFCSPHIGHO2_01_FULL_64_10]